LLLGGAAVLTLVTFSLVAAAKLSKTGDASAGFHATGPAGLSIDGSTSDVTIADDGTTVTITAGLGSIKTGADLRDQHTKEDLEVSKFPTATLAVARSALKMGGGSGDAPGKLTIHGTTKDVTFRYTANKSGNTLDVSGSATINVKDFGVKPRSYLSITIKDSVDIKAAFKATDN
jgi:polyisoprenoid-binding protein YceI